MALKIIDHGSKEYQLMVQLRNDILRKPLGMDFTAEELEKEYTRLNLRDDQFDISDALISIAIAVAAVAALVDAWWLLYFAWGSGCLGMAFGIAGFAEIGLRAQWLASLLGT